MHPQAPTMMPATEAPSAKARSITLRFPVVLYDRLRSAAQDDHRSINSMAALLLAQALDEIGA